MDRSLILAVTLATAFVTFKTSAAFNTAGRPIAVDDGYTVSSGSTLAVAAPGVLANDTDPDGEALTTVLVSGPSHGVLTFARDGSFIYRAEAGFVGEDTFLYVANDGHTVSLRATARINVIGTNPPPVVSIVSPSDNAVKSCPAAFNVVADAADSGGTIQKVHFFLNEVAVAEVARPPFYFAASNCAPGSYRMLAVATSSTGLSTTSAPVTIEVISSAPAAGPIAFNELTGLFEQSVVISNRTSEAWSGGVRLVVSNLGSNQLQNATGAAGSDPYVETLDPVPSGVSAAFVLQYLVPDGGSTPTPMFVAVPLLIAEPHELPRITSITPTSNEMVAIQFTSQTGGVYYVQCSEDLVQWKIETTPIISAGASTLALRPRMGGKCFYRIIRLP